MLSFSEHQTADFTQFRKVLAVSQNPQADGFVLPDGTLLSLGRWSMHDLAAQEAGMPLSKAMVAGIVRYSGRDGITVSAPLTASAAQTVHDNFLHTPMAVDIMDPASGRVKSFKRFDGRHTADAIRNFVRKALDAGKQGIWLQEEANDDQEVSPAQRNSGIVHRFSGFVKEENSQPAKPDHCEWGSCLRPAEAFVRFRNVLGYPTAEGYWYCGEHADKVVTNCPRGDFIERDLREATAPALPLPDGWTMTTENTAAYSGQTNWTTAIFNEHGTRVAYVDYVIFGERHATRRDGGVLPDKRGSVYRDEITISMIEVQPEFQRRGLGMALLRAISAKHKLPINSGMRTDDGGKLWDRWVSRPERLPESVMEDVAHVYRVYHGTDVRFKRFDVKKGNQPIIWFTSDKARIERNDVNARGKGYVVTADVTIHKPAGWKDYKNLTLGEIKARGFDGVVLPDPDGSFNCFVWNAAQIKIVATDVMEGVMSFGEFGLSDRVVSAAPEALVDPL